MSAIGPDTHDTIQYMLGVLDGKMDLVLNSVSGHDKRITALEHKQWWATGAAAVAGVVLTKITPIANILGFH